MSINPMYMIASSLQEYFVDKDTGLPLSGGIVSFWEDENRTVPKAVYTLSGSPPNYTYAVLPNPLILSAVGTPQYNGNDIVIYYYPYDDNGNVELYYITVTDSLGEDQFTRQAWPNFSLQSIPSNGQELFNFIPNPQFIMHNNLPYDDTINPPWQIGQIRQGITQIAPGGWTFERPSTSTAIDYVTFFRYGSFVDEPTQSPRYAVEVNTTTPNITDAFKNLCINFSDVNKFTDNPNPSVTNQVYTLYFEAQTINSANFNVTIQIIKNFGTGGSSPVTLTFNTVTITNTLTAYLATLDFGENSSYTIGDLDDDSVKVVLSLPTTLGFNGIFTNFVLAINNITIEQFPTTTDDDMLSRSMVAPVPDPNGFDIGLPLVNTKSGLMFDDSQVGNIYSTVVTQPGFGEYMCFGQIIETAGYSPDGIPHQRLFNKIVDVSTGIGKWGTGLQYVSVYGQPSLPTDTNLILMTNFPGAQNATTDGLVPTGFSFTNICNGNNYLQFRAFFVQNFSLWIQCTFYGPTTGLTNSGTWGAGVGLTISRVGQLTSGFNTEGFVNGIKQLIYLNIVAAPTAGQYFNIACPSQQFYVWFTIDGSGSDPAPGGIGLRVNLLSSMDIPTIQRSICSVLNGWQATEIITVAGSGLSSNSYWNFYANGTHYYVWYNLNNTGTDPSLANAVGIPVIYNTSMSAGTIGQITLNTINKKYYAIPNCQGVFLRGVDNGTGNDPDVFLRFSTVPILNEEELVGSYQWDEIVSHLHPMAFDIANVFATRIPSYITNSEGLSPVDFNTFYTGGDETRPINVAVNYKIKL
jgi:hypothetical protein